jgi:hypothetical protein
LNLETGGGAMKRKAERHNPIDTELATDPFEDGSINQFF